MIKRQRAGMRQCDGDVLGATGTVGDGGELLTSVDSGVVTDRLTAGDTMSWTLNHHHVSGGVGQR